jgi:hypothetical protein
MATDAIAPFLWGAGGARLTPEEIASQRKMAQSLLTSGGDYSPVASPWQGAARVSQALFGGMLGHDAGEASQQNATESAALINQAIASSMGGATSPTASPAATAAPPASPMGATAIPAGEVDPRLSAAIGTAAASSGVDPAYMTRLAMVENGGKVDGTSTLSSASGPFQFINSTAKQYGLTNPNDPTASADAAARLTLDNKAALTQALGREPTMGELYLAHQQGAGGAAKLLANPNAPVESVIGAQAAANNGAAPGMTAGQFANKWTSRFSDLGQTQTVDPNQPSPLDVAQYPSGPVDAPVAGADPAALPANSAPAQGFAVPGQPARPSINPAILKAMTSPYVDPQTKAVATLLFKSQMDAQTKANDPMRALQMQKLQAEIDKASGKSGTTEYGLTPIFGQNANGETVLGVPGKDGTFKQLQLPDGFKPQSGIEKIDLGTQVMLRDKKSGQVVGVEQKDLRGEQSEKAIGKAQGAAKFSLPTDIYNADQTVKQIDELIANPGLSSIVGPLDQFRGSWSLGDQGRDALARFNQLKGKAFLSAYATLRGGGQITEVEGTKAENAMARMDRAQSEGDFKNALTDFRDAVKTGMDKMREKAGGVSPQSAPAGKTSSGVSWSIQ